MIRIIRKLVASCFVFISSTLMFKPNAFVMNEITNLKNIRIYQDIKCELRLRECPVDDGNKNASHSDKGNKNLSFDRRDFLQKSSLGIALISPSIAQANGLSRPIFGKFQKDSIMAATALQSESAVRSPINIGAKTAFLSSELCLLNLLPVSNKTFRKLQQKIEDTLLLTDLCK